MRLQLSAKDRSKASPRAFDSLARRRPVAQLIVAALAVLAPALAHADGSRAGRGVYYKERATRVEQPMLDAIFDAGARGLVHAHLLVDAITSASAGSGAADATPFTEHRYEAGAGYVHELDGPHAIPWIDKLRLGADAKYSTESDYWSFYGGGRIEADVAQQNATLAIGGGISADRVGNNAGNNPMVGPTLVCDNARPDVKAGDCPLDTYSLTASASQIVSKDAVVALSYDLAKLEGFQSNPYRTVVTNTSLVPERHPNERLRQSVAISGRLFLPRTRTTLIAAYRFYWDDWDIHAHTPELRLVQQVGLDADATLGYRYYRQSAAYFYRTRYGDPTMTDYLTDDPKMSAFTGDVVETKLGVYGHAFGLPGNWAGARFEGILEYIIQHNRFGNAVVAHVALTFPFSY
jgi:hypothetical protein